MIDTRSRPAGARVPGRLELLNDKENAMKTAMNGWMRVAVALGTLGSGAGLPACENDGGNAAESLPIQDPTTEFPANATASAGASTDKASCVSPRNDITAYRMNNVRELRGWPPSQFSLKTTLVDGTLAFAGEDANSLPPGGYWLWLEITDLEGIKIECYDRNTGGYMGFITSHAGFWGDWLPRIVPTPYVVGNPYVSGLMRIEAPQGIGDDTAANDVAMRGLMETTFNTPPWATPWGTWGQVAWCPTGTAICGVNTRMEAPQGVGDDTALNGVAFACCNF